MTEREELLAALDEGAYADVEVPTGEEIREALRKSREELRRMAEARRPRAVDPSIRFRQDNR